MISNRVYPIKSLLSILFIAFLTTPAMYLLLPSLTAPYFRGCADVWQVFHALYSGLFQNLIAFPTAFIFPFLFFGGFMFAYLLRPSKIAGAVLFVYTSTIITSPFMIFLLSSRMSGEYILR